MLGDLYLKKKRELHKYLEVPAPSNCCRSNGGSKICSRSSFDNSKSAN